MYLMVIVINKTETVNKILEMFFNIGIRGATIFDSRGMGQTFMDCESPVVGGLRSLIYDQCRPNNTTILSVLESLDQYDQAIREVEKITGSFNEPGTGIALAFPLVRLKGYSPNNKQ